MQSSLILPRPIVALLRSCPVSPKLQVNDCTCSRGCCRLVLQCSVMVQLGPAQSFCCSKVDLTPESKNFPCFSSFVSIWGFVPFWNCAAMPKLSWTLLRSHRHLANPYRSNPLLVWLVHHVCRCGRCKCAIDNRISHISMPWLC